MEREITDEFILALTTAPNSIVAKDVATALVEKSLAACVSIVNNVTSVYRWKGEVVEDSECVLLIKTKAVLFEKLKAEILELNPYDVPEIIATPIVKGHREYLEWISASVR